MNGVMNPESRNEILEAIDEEIRGDKVLRAQIETIIETPEVYRFISKLLSTLPKIVIVIDELNDEVKEACQSLKYETKFVEFKTFVREDAPNVHAHLFEPLIEVEFYKGIPTQNIEQKKNAMLEQMESEEVRELLSECFRRIELLNVEMKPLTYRWISVWHKRKRFMLICARKKFFWLEIEKLDGKWLSFKIRNKKDLEDAFSEGVEPILRLLENRETK